MKLLRTDVEALEISEFYDGDIPEYAILSHTWLADKEEITYGQRNDESLDLKAGWPKIAGSKRQALLDGLNYIWIDTLCIDKTSSVELAEAINSMFRYYEEAKVCYVYLMDLADGASQDIHRSSACGAARLVARNTEAVLAKSSRSVQEDSVNSVPGSHTFGDAVIEIADSGVQPERRLEAATTMPVESSFGGAGGIPVTHEVDLEALSRCRWFTRGWTLQELLAPTKIEFYSKSWIRLPLNPLSEAIASITGIHLDAIEKTRSIYTYSIAQRMSWAANRETRRIEDRAYSLLGIFDISFSVIYGEGKRAFRRLQEELLRRTQDQTIFAFGVYDPEIELSLAVIEYKSKGGVQGNGDLLAESPDDFRDSRDIVPIYGLKSTQFRLANSEVSFETLAVDFRCDQARTGEVASHRAPSRFTGEIAANPQKAILLACGFTSEPTRIVFLNIIPSSSHRQKYHVVRHTNRLTFSDVIVRGLARKEKRSTWDVVCSLRDHTFGKPGLADVAEAPPTALICRYLVPGQTFYRPQVELRGTSNVGTWSSECLAFSLPDMNQPGVEFVGNLELWIGASLVTTLSIKYCKRDLPIRIFDLRIRFASSILPDSWGHIIGTWIWQGRGFIVAKASHAWRTKDGRHMPVVSIHQEYIWREVLEIYEMAVTVIWVSLWLLGAVMLYAWLPLLWVAYLGLATTAWIYGGFAAELVIALLGGLLLLLLTVQLCSLEGQGLARRIVYEAYIREWLLKQLAKVRVMHVKRGFGIIGGLISLVPVIVLPIALTLIRS